jgi:hypothetical protein
MRQGYEKNHAQPSYKVKIERCDGGTMRNLTRALLAGSLLALGFGGCGSSGNSKVAAEHKVAVEAGHKVASETQTARQRYEETSDSAVVEAEGGSYGIARGATGVGYEKLNPVAQLDAVEVYLHSPIGEIDGKNINPHALVDAAKRFILKGNITDELTTIFSEAISEIEAKQKAREGAISERQEEHRRHLLEARAAVGKTGPEVEQLLGPPQNHQEIGGEKLWYYQVVGPRQGESEEWQIIFSGTTVASENQY